MKRKWSSFCEETVMAKLRTVRPPGGQGAFGSGGGGGGGDLML